MSFKKTGFFIGSFLFASLSGFASVNMTRPPAEQLLAHDIYKQLIESPSGFSSGSTTPLVKAMAERLKDAGFAEEDIFIGGASPEKANLVVRLHGSGEQKPVLLLAHTDVVEAKASDWSMEPFILHEKDGYFYGRGTLDDKAQAALWLANLIQFKKEGFKPKRDIIVALTADEEGKGPYNGVLWILENHKDLIQADFALNEGGWGDMLDGQKISQNVQISEKYLLDFELEVHNKGGHSSIPVNDNAIYQLANALQRLSKWQFPLKTDEVTSTYFKKLAAIEKEPLKSSLLKAAQNSQVAMQQVAAQSPVWNATLRTTCTPTLLAGGHATNALPQLASVHINCRVLPGDSPESVENALKEIINDPQVKITQTGSVDRGPNSPLRPDVLNTIAQVTHQFWPNVPTVPMMVTGATDGRFLRKAGIPTYGVMGMFFERSDLQRAHGRDERISMQTFYEGQAFLYDLVKKLST